MKASLVVNYHLEDKIFDLTDKQVNRDNYAYSIWLLREVLKGHNIELSTSDIHSPSESDICLCFDLPTDLSGIDESNSYLFLFESEVIKPKSWDKSKHQKFKRVFTWDDRLAGKGNYYKFDYTHLFPTKNQYALGDFEEKKLCTLISANKIVSHSLELYSKRVEAIRWFEKNAPKDFDLYGIGWDEYATSNRYLRHILKRLPVLKAFFAPKFTSYKGKVDSKSSVLQDYKFAICYENAQKLNGYITEKIFDCFFAGCVPVYWGAPNVTDFIPKNCFIDYRDFSHFEKLYNYISNMQKEEYEAYQKNIADFLFSDKSEQFRAEYFSEQIMDCIKADFCTSK